MSKPAAVLQQRITLLKSKAINVFWCSSNRNQISFWRDIVRDTRLAAMNVNCELLSSHEAGWSSESFRHSLSSSLNHRMQNFLDEQSFGHTFLDTGFRFSWGTSLLHLFDRLEASIFIQFISDHFPSNAYFCRFSFATQDDSLSLSCLSGSGLETRDHLLFERELFEVERIALLRDIKSSADSIDQIAWKKLGKCPNALLK